MGRPAIVLDTNVVLSAAFARQSIPAQVFDKALTDGQVLLSQPLWEELRDVLTRRHVLARLSAERIDELLEGYRRAARWLKPDRQVLDSPDPDDAMLFELSITGHADFLVTGDKRLWVLDPYGARGTRVVSPRSFLDLIG